jgi:hypothetical protein
LDASENVVSAKVKIAPPCVMPMPLTMAGSTVIATLACPGLIDSRSRPRLRSIESWLHKKSAHASASLQDEIAVSLLTGSSSKNSSNAMTRTDKHVQPAQLTIPHAAGFDGTVTLFETRRVLQSEDVSTAAGNQLGL